MSLTYLCEVIIKIEIKQSGGSEVVAKRVDRQGGIVEEVKKHWYLIYTNGRSQIDQKLKSAVESCSSFEYSDGNSTKKGDMKAEVTQTYLNY